MRNKKLVYNLLEDGDMISEQYQVKDEASTNPNNIWLANDKIFIRVPGIIEQDFYNLVSSFLLDVAIAHNKSDIVLLVDSDGGELAPTLGVYGLLEAMDNKIITVAFNRCCSAACVLFALGKERYFLKDTEYIIHQIRTSIYMESQVQTTQVKKIADSLEACQNDYRKIIMKKTKIPKDKLDSIFSSVEDTRFKNEEIIAYNIATKVFKKFSSIPL